MFKLEPSLRIIEAAEKDVVAIYRSASDVTVAPAGLAAAPYEAFICTINEDSTERAYVALVHATRKTPLLIFTEDETSRERPPAERLDEALSFAGSMGFTMENVNLNYSRALREVILRNVRVIRLPQDAKKSVQVTIPAIKAGVESAAAALATEKPTPAATVAVEGAAEVAKPVKSGAAQLAMERAEAVRTMHEKEKGATERLGKDKLLAEKIAAEKRAAQWAAQRAAAERLAQERAEAEQAERARILAEKTKAEKRAEEQAELARRARQRAEEERGERERLQAE